MTVTICPSRVVTIGSGLVDVIAEDSDSILSRHFCQRERAEKLHLDRALLTIFDRTTHTC
jgi:hypothetical protein